MRTAVEMLPFDSPNASMLHDWRSRGQAAAPLNQLLHTCLGRATPATCCRHSASGRQPAARATRALQMSAKGTPTSSPTCWISPESTKGPSRGAWASGCALSVVRWLQHALAGAGALHAACPCRLRDHRGRHLDMKPGTSGFQQVCLTSHVTEQCLPSLATRAQAAPNKFSDLTFPEFSQKMLMQPGAFDPVAAAAASSAAAGPVLGPATAPRLGRMMMGAISYEESLRRLMQVRRPVLVRL